jgi:hypothetical protein
MVMKVKIRSKLRPPECRQAFIITWPSDLVFKVTWPSFELDLDIIEINILTKLEEDRTKIKYTVMDLCITSSQDCPRLICHCERSRQYVIHGATVLYENVILNGQHYKESAVYFIVHVLLKLQWFLNGDRPKNRPRQYNVFGHFTLFHLRFWVVRHTLVRLTIAWWQYKYNSTFSELLLRSISVITMHKISGV